MTRRLRTCLRQLRSDDSGRIMILTLGLAVVLLALVFVVVSVSAVHIERKQLLAMADAAAADAASRISEEAYYSGEMTAQVGLSDESVRAAAADYVARFGAQLGVPEAQVAEPTGSPEGRSAQVTLTTVARIPLVPALAEPMGAGLRLTVTSIARAG